MNEKEWREQLAKDDFKEIWVRADKPNCEYEAHEHPVDTTHVVLRGSLQVKMNGKTYEIKENERLDIEKHIEHSAKIGSQGCTFLMAAKV